MSTGPLINAETALLVLAGAPELEAGDLASPDQHAQAVAEQHDARIILADAESHQILNTARLFGTPLPDPAGKSFAERAGVSRTAQASNLFRGAAADELLVSVYVPILKNTSGALILAMAMRPETLSTVFKDQQVPEGWTITIFDRDGLIVARKRALAQFLGKPVSARLKKAIASAEEGAAVMNCSGGSPTSRQELNASPAPGTIVPALLAKIRSSLPGGACSASHPTSFSRRPRS
jgi:hypothetical protein